MNPITTITKDNEDDHDVVGTAQEEAQFLSSRESRMEVRRSAAEKRRMMSQESSSQQVQEWNRLRQDLAQWRKQVEQLLSLDGGGGGGGDSRYDNTAVDDKAPTTSDSTTSDSNATTCSWNHQMFCPPQQQQPRSSLEDMQAELRHLQHKSRIVQQEANGEWPITDLRLLHDEFTSCFTLLDEKRQLLMPSSKFVFKRYRAELARRQRHQCHLDHHLSAPLTTTSTNQVRSRTDNVNDDEEKDEEDTVQRTHAASILIEGDNVVQGFYGVNITIDLGQITIAPMIFMSTDRLPSSSPSSSSSLPPLTTIYSTSTSIILSNIRHCQITIRCKLQSLHLSDLVDCKIISSQVDPSPTKHDDDDDKSADGPPLVVDNVGVVMVKGALHVTNCQQVDFYHVVAHQLRIHTSVDLQFRAKSSVLSGVILEESHGITFYGQDAGSCCWEEVKDFGWFQRGKPSPNFKIVLGQDDDDDDDDDDMEEKNVIVPTPRQEMSSVATGSAVVPLSTLTAAAPISDEEKEEDDDDDDEL